MKHLKRFTYFVIVPYCYFPESRLLSSSCRLHFEQFFWLTCATRLLRIQADLCIDDFVIPSLLLTTFHPSPFHSFHSYLYHAIIFSSHALSITSKNTKI